MNYGKFVHEYVCAHTCVPLPISDIICSYVGNPIILGKYVSDLKKEKTREIKGIPDYALDDGWRICKPTIIGNTMFIPDTHYSLLYTYNLKTEKFRKTVAMSEHEWLGEAHVRVGGESKRIDRYNHQIKISLSEKEYISLCGPSYEMFGFDLDEGGDECVTYEIGQNRNWWYASAIELYQGSKGHPWEKICAISGFGSGTIHLVNLSSKKKYGGFGKVVKILKMNQLQLSELCKDEHDYNFRFDILLFDGNKLYAICRNMSFIAVFDINTCEQIKGWYVCNNRGERIKIEDVTIYENYIYIIPDNRGTNLVHSYILIYDMEGKYVSEWNNELYGEHMKLFGKKCRPIFINFHNCNAYVTYIFVNGNNQLAHIIRKFE